MHGTRNRMEHKSKSQKVWKRIKKSENRLKKGKNRKDNQRIGMIGRTGEWRMNRRIRTIGRERSNITVTYGRKLKCQGILLKCRGTQVERQVIPLKWCGYIIKMSWRCHGKTIIVMKLRCAFWSYTNSWQELSQEGTSIIHELEMMICWQLWHVRKSSAESHWKTARKAMWMPGNWMRTRGWITVIEVVWNYH